VTHVKNPTLTFAAMALIVSPPTIRLCVLVLAASLEILS